MKKLLSRAIATLCVLALPMLVATVLAAPGELDPTFSTASSSPHRPAGVVRGAPSPSVSASTVSTGFVAVRSDGGYYAANPCLNTAGAASICVTSYGANGAMENQFSPIVPVVQTGGTTLPGAVAVDGNDHAWVAGVCSGQACVAKQLRSGVAANNLGASSNLSLITIPGMLFAGAITVAPSQKIMVGGRCNDGVQFYPCVARLLANGAIDPTFNGGNVSGWGNDPFAQNERLVDGNVRKLVALPGGRVYAGARCTLGGFEHMCLAIIEDNGTRNVYAVPNSQDGLDYYSYYLLVLPTTTGAVFADLAVQTDGFALLYGTCQQTIQPQRAPCLARVRPGVGLDLYFANVGFSKPYLRPEPMDASGLVLRQDGTLITLANCDVTELAVVRRRLCIQSLTPSGGFSFQLLNNSAANDIEFDPNTTPLRLVWDGVGATRYRDTNVLAVAICPDAGGFRWLCVAKISLAPPQAPNCTPDLDGDGRSAATTDAALIARIARGTANDSVITQLTGAGASRTTWTSIRNFLNTNCGTAFTQ
jgi:hypothetical protein